MKFSKDYHDNGASVILISRTYIFRVPWLFLIDDHWSTCLCLLCVFTLCARKEEALFNEEILREIGTARKTNRNSR